MIDEKVITCIETAVHFIERHRTLIFSLQNDNTITVSTSIDAYYNTKKLFVIESGTITLNNLRESLKTLGLDTLLKENGSILIVNNLNAPNRSSLRFSNENVIVNWNGLLSSNTSFDPIAFLERFSRGYPDFFERVPSIYDSALETYKDRYPHVVFPDIPDRHIDFRIMGYSNGTLTGTAYLCIADANGQIYGGDENLSTKFSL